MTQIQELKAELSLKHYPMLNARAIKERNNARQRTAYRRRLYRRVFTYSLLASLTVTSTIALTAWCIETNPLGMQPTVKHSTHVKSVPSLPACTFLNTADPYRAEYNAFPICYRV
jgi:hypothetical protein